MKNNFITRQVIFSASLLLILFAGSCKKKDLFEQSRLFRPTIKGQLESNGNWILSSWQKVKGATSYTVEISRDTFRTIDRSFVTDTNVVRIEEILWDQLYQIQVRAEAPDPVYNSRMSYLGEIKTPRFPTILSVPGSSDISEAAVKVSWINEGAAVTSIKVLKASDSSVLREVMLTPGDISNQYKIVSGLNSSSPYIFYLYSGTSVRGWVNVTTKEPLVGNLIDLRGLDMRPGLLSDTLQSIPSGSIVILQRGATYEISSAINLARSVTFISGTDLSVPEPAIIYMPNNFTFASGTAVDSVVFKEVILRGSDYASKYVFNIGNATTVGKIGFESCQIEFFRGVVRLQSSNTINISNFVINNCLVDSIAGYGLLTVDNVNSKVDNIIITNSTISKAEKVITSRQNSNSILIENCTINQAPLPGNYLIDYSTSGTNEVLSGIKIYNTIMGAAKIKADGTTAVRGIRAGASTSVDVNGTYHTADYSAVSNPLPNIIAYARPSTELFENPEAGNFSIIDMGFPGRNTAGDPRWRP